jgi:hypothetical protein
MKEPTKLARGPSFVTPIMDKVNELIDATRPARNIEGRGGMKITASDTNIVIEPPESSGLPAGYGPEEWNVCINGSPGTRNFITDNPD